MADDSTHISPHPKQLAIPLPQDFKIERTEHSLRISGPAGRWLASLNRITVTVEAGQLEVRQAWFQTRVFRISAAHIEQLYVKEGYDRSESYPEVKLHTIAEETTARLAPQAPALRCDECLGKCVAHLIRLAELYELTYYGCQSCFQSRNFIEFKGQIIALLDNRLETAREWQADRLRVNWLARRQPFSFDAVLLLSP